MIAPRRPQPHGGWLKSGADPSRKRSLGYLQAMRNAWRPYDRRPIYVWGAEHIIIPLGVYTVSGRFDVLSSRYLLKPFDALQSDVVRKVTCQWPTRSGKSLLADIWLMWLIAQSSGPTMWNFNTDPQARKHFRTRLLPLMLATRVIADLLPTDLRKLTQEVMFRDGVPLYVQGPALDNLQGVGVCNLIEDELWRRESGRHAQALSRLGDYERLGMDKNLNIGQGGFEGDDQDLEYRAGTQEEWQITCMQCGYLQDLLFRGDRPDGSMFGMRFGDRPDCKDKHGDWVISKVVPTIRWECGKCGHAHVDEHRTKSHWNLGDYAVKNWDAPRVTPPDVAPKLEDFINRSFNIDALMTKSWADQVIKYCQAQNQLRMGNLEPLIALTQKDRARSWSETAWLNSKPTPTYDISKTWPEAVYRFITIDVQEEGVKWLLVCDWSAKGESRPLWYGKVFGEAEIQAKQKEFNVRPNNVFMDAGHDPKGSTGVYAMCVRNGWIALKGDDRKGWTHTAIIKTAKGPAKVSVERSYSGLERGDPESGRIGQGVQFAKLIWWSNPTIKNRFHRQRDRGKVVFPSGDMAWVLELKKQIAGEWKRRIRNQITGKFREVWCDNGENHGFDCYCMQIVAATLAKILVDDPTAELLAGCETPATDVVEMDQAA